MLKNKFVQVLLAVAFAALMPLAAHAGIVSYSDLSLIGFAGVVLSDQGARVIDPVLTNIAQGYHNSDFVGNFLFPRVPVQASGGQIIEFGKEAFYQYNLRRAPGGRTQRINFGYLGRNFALLQDSVEVPVPREHMRDASVVPGIDLGRRAVNLGMQAVTKSLEYDQATLATNAANYDANHKLVLAGATKWSASTGTPTNDINTAREAIRSSVGVYPNLALLSAVAFNAVINNPNVINRFQYTSSDVITEEMLAKLWNIDKVVVGKAITMTDANVASDMWGNNAILAFTNLGSQNAEEPSYGYTYTMDGNPLVEQSYWDPATKSWVYPVNFERVPVQSGITSGFLLQSPA